METTKFKCNYCFKEYTRKSFYNKHVLCCEILNNTKRENEIIREEEENPTISQLYTIIKELNHNYKQLKNEMEEMKRHVYKTKKKKYIVEWLNENKKESIDIDNYLDNIQIDISTIVNNNYNKVFELLFEKDKEIPICCFDQNKNTLFIFHENKWDICSFEKLKDIIDTLNMRILRLITQHSLTASEEYCNIIKQLMNNKTDYNNIKKNIYSHLKTNITHIVEYEFV
jgi:hypothetical protein